MNGQSGPWQLDALDWAMAAPAKHCHSPHMALQIWRTLIFGCWKSHDLVTDTLTHSSSPEIDRVSIKLCITFSPSWQVVSCSGVAQNDCQGWKSSQRNPLALGDTGQTALEEGQERRGPCLLLDICCHLPRDTLLPVSSCCSYLLLCGQRRGRYLVWALGLCSLSSQCCCNLPGPSHRGPCRMCRQNCSLSVELNMAQKGMQRLESEGGATFSPCPAGFRYIHGHACHARGQERVASSGEVLSTASKKHRWETTVPVLVPGDGDVVVCGGRVVVPGKGGGVVGAGG